MPVGTTRTRRFATGRLEHRTGREGPVSDPRGYEERCAFFDSGDSVVYHEGLATWLEVNGVRCDFSKANVPNRNYLIAFERCTGISVKAFDKIMARPRACCAVPLYVGIMSCPDSWDVTCARCGRVVGGCQDLSAIK